MEGKSATAISERTPRKRPAMTVFMRPGALARLYDATGLPRNNDKNKTLKYHAIAADLGLHSPSSLHAADRKHNPQPVNVAIVGAIRNRFPHVRYEDVFTEGVHPGVQATSRAA